MQLHEFLAKAERGTAAAIARELGVSAVMLSQWTAKSGAKQIPEERCPDIERVTVGKVPCEESRPDIPWHRVADRAWPWHRKGRPTIDVTRTVPEAG